VETEVRVLAGQLEIGVMKNAFLIGQQIYLRPYEKSDAAVLAEYFNDWDVCRTLRPGRPLSIDAEQAFLEGHHKNESSIMMGIALKSDDRLIGGLGIHNLSLSCRSASVGLFIGDKKEWGKGYGSAALKLLIEYGFDNLNLNRIWLRVHADNPRAKGIYERLGFKLEGCLRQDMFREGKYIDTLMMGILRDEWLAIAK
jgi:RimJ/RimL family protein N-acetyltransferase